MFSCLKLCYPIGRVVHAGLQPILKNINPCSSVAICAIRVLWYFVSDWLSRFAYWVPFYWWIWPLAFLLVASVTVLTISCRSWRAMREDLIG